MRIVRTHLFIAAFACALASPAFAGAPSSERSPAQRVFAHRVDQRATQAEPFVAATYARRQMPILAGIDPRTYAIRKAFAARDPFAPVDLSAGDASPLTTPVASPKFKGMADSASVCPYFGGCEPPDMAIAASTSWVVQVVNTSIAVYGPTGRLHAGFPKNARTFFSIPDPSPGGCDPQGPFTSDPRAFYDRATGHFVVAMLQVEGNFGIAQGCTPLSKIWIAASQTSDPTGAWNVYNVDMDFSHSGFALDYTQLGFDDQAVYFGGNMFGRQADNSPFEYDEIFFASKAAIESGSPLTVNGFFNMTAGGGTLDTLQPEETQTSPAQRPGVEYLVGSENIAFGGGQCVTGCNGLDVYAIVDPLGSPSLTGVHITMTNYTLAPAGDEPGCAGCIETLDTRISGTPVYTASRGGVISFALESGVNVGSSVLPGIMWGEVQPTIDPDGSVTGASMVQSGFIKGTGDEADSFGATMASPDGSLWVVYDRMSSTLNPSIAFRVQRSTDPPGHLESKRALKGGLAPTFDSRWGDYEATTLDDAGFVWFASEFSGSGGDWSTFIGRDI